MAPRSHLLIWWWSGAAYLLLDQRQFIRKTEKCGRTINLLLNPSNNLLLLIQSLLQRMRKNNINIITFNEELSVTWTESIHHHQSIYLKGRPLGDDDLIMLCYTANKSIVAAQLPIILLFAYCDPRLLWLQWYAGILLHDQNILFGRWGIEWLGDS